MLEGILNTVRTGRRILNELGSATGVTIAGSRDGARIEAHEAGSHARRAQNTYRQRIYEIKTDELNGKQTNSDRHHDAGGRHVNGDVTTVAYGSPYERGERAPADAINGHLNNVEVRRAIETAYSEGDLSGKDITTLVNNLETLTNRDLSKGDGRIDYRQMSLAMNEVIGTLDLHHGHINALEQGNPQAYHDFARLTSDMVAPTLSTQRTQNGAVVVPTYPSNGTIDAEEFTRGLKTLQPNDARALITNLETISGQTLINDKGDVDIDASTKIVTRLMEYNKQEQHIPGFEMANPAHYEWLVGQTELMSLQVQQERRGQGGQLTQLFNETSTQPLSREAENQRIISEAAELNTWRILRDLQTAQANGRQDYIQANLSLIQAYNKSDLATKHGKIIISEDGGTYELDFNGLDPRVQQNRMNADLAVDKGIMTTEEANTLKQVSYAPPVASKDTTQPTGTFASYENAGKENEGLTNLARYSEFEKLKPVPTSFPDMSGVLEKNPFTNVGITISDDMTPVLPSNSIFPSAGKDTTTGFTSMARYSEFEKLKPVPTSFPDMSGDIKPTPFNADDLITPVLPNGEGKQAGTSRNR
ncbi:MAG: hypothetical protein F6K62_09820 [Sphaerospermopsis sp. SIO1G2]|nr:hypothetical protein [Sphaerospermopsis sp. SIO1G2]